ncbi:MAG: hypothetical protein K1X94_23905 [Sandaracinaceae bacterium]|nr:hypothetical protein [Sandaracinaceae bacterium]
MAQGAWAWLALAPLWLAGCDRQVRVFIDLPTPRVERVIELREYVGSCPVGTETEPDAGRPRPITPDDPDVVALGTPRSVQFIDVDMPMSRPLGVVREPRALIAFGRDASCQVVSSACRTFRPGVSDEVVLGMNGHTAPGPGCAACADGVCQ